MLPVGTVRREGLLDRRFHILEQQDTDQSLALMGIGAANETRTLATILLPNLVARPTTGHYEGLGGFQETQHFQYPAGRVNTERYGYKRISRPVP
jgi:hypothetical protein